MEQARIEHAPNGSLLTYITSADALVNDDEPKAQWAKNVKQPTSVNSSTSLSSAHGNSLTVSHL